MYNIIPLAITIFSIAIIIFILIRKIPEISALDVAMMPEEKQKRVKSDLLRKRFERKFEVVANSRAGLATRGLFKKLLSLKFFDQIRARVLALERKYHWKHEDIQVVKEGIGAILREAEELKLKGELEEAEKKFIKVIEVEPENPVPYRGLSGIYLTQGNYEEARETLEHILKLTNKKSDSRFCSDYLNLGLVYKNLGNNARACLNFKRASNLEPNNPKILDLLCEMSIIVKDKKVANMVCRRLEAVNPENQKIDEFKEKIEQIE